MHAENEVIKTVADLVGVVRRLDLADKENAHVRAWFRGQGDESWPLRLGVCRMFALDEDERIRKERHLTQDFEGGSASRRAQGQSYAEIYMIQQHHGAPTRLLDWSRSPLTALFFALEQMDPASPKDGAIYVLDAFRFDDGGRGLCTSRSNEVGRAMKAIFDWDDECWPDRIIPIRPLSSEARVAAQRGFFTFHPPKVPSLEPDSNPTLKKYRVSASDQGSLRKELDMLGIDEFVAYGDLDHLSKVLRRMHGLR